MIVKRTMFPHQIFIKLIGHSWWKDSRSNWLHFDRQETAIGCTWCLVLQSSRLWWWPLLSSAGKS
jgi:hypothetical protein